MTKLNVSLNESDYHVLEDRGFSLKTLLGQGSYAKVFKSIHMDDDGRHNILACKVIDTAQAPREYLTKFLPRELDILIRVNHPHIVHVSSIFQRRAKYFIFLRFAENGDLLDFLTQNGAVSETQARFWMRQILSGLHYIHTISIAHRDLKCENILITANFNVKITDFGFARVVQQKSRDILSETYCGSLSYASPEVLKGRPYYPKPSDMWSVGIIMYTMLNKALPFNETSVKRLHEKQVMRKWRFRSSIVNQLSMECRKQVTDLLEPEPQLRPTAWAVLTGPWVAMDERLTKLSFLEETLLKEAEEEIERKSGTKDDILEAERLAELRRKSRAKETLKVLKQVNTQSKSQQVIIEE